MEGIKNLIIDLGGVDVYKRQESIFGKDSQVGMWPGTAATEAKIVDTQTSYVVPLQFDLFNEKNKPLAIRHLVAVSYTHLRLEKRRKTPRRVWPPSSQPRISIRRIISG